MNRRRSVPTTSTVVHKIAVRQVKREKPKIQDFEEMCLLGKGSFGTVNLLRHRESQALFACKVVAKTPQSLNEREILQTLKSSNFCVHISDFFEDETNQYFLMEYLPGGELF